MQLVFQVVLASDAQTSFVFFLYHNPEEIVAIATDSARIGLVGFDAGDLRRSTTILSAKKKDYDLENLNVFRVDGRL